MQRQTIWLLVVVLLALGAWPALQFVRGYRAERVVVTPPHGPVPMTDEVRALGATAHRISTRQGAVAGWFVPPKGGATIILCHGSSADRRSLLDVAGALIAAGHGVWMFDWPGHGESDGRVDFGVGSREALQTVVDTLATWRAVDASRLGIYAFSMGGVVAVPVAATEKRLRALVLVSSPVDLERQLAYEYASAGRMAAMGADFFWRSRGLPLAELNSRAVAGELAPRPVVVVAGDADRSVPPSEGAVLAAAIGSTASLWTIHGAGHGEYLKVDSTYGPRVAAFFTHALPPLAPADTLSSRGAAAPSALPPPP